MIDYGNQLPCIKYKIPNPKKQIPKNKTQITNKSQLPKLQLPKQNGLDFGTCVLDII